MERKTKIELAILGVLLIVGAYVYKHRAALGLAVADLAEGAYWPLPDVGQPFTGFIQSASDNWGVPFDLIARQIWQESKFDPNVVASDGGSGLMQLTPRYYGGVSLFDPQSNINAGVDSVANYFNMYGSWAKALAAYNAGPGNVNKAIAAATAAGDPSQWLLNLPAAQANQTITRRYVGQILSDVPIEALPPGALT